MSIQRDPAIDELTGDAVETVPIARPDRRPAAVALVLVAFVGLALAKPWSPDRREPARPLVAGATTSAPSAAIAAPDAPDALAELRRDCQDPIGWRVYSHEVWNGSPVRVWRRLEPDPVADGPLDPGLPVVEVGPLVSAVGYCSPWSGGERPPDGASIAAWRVAPGATGPLATPIALVEVAPRVRTVLGALFDPTRPNGLDGGGAPSSPGAGADARDGRPQASGSGGRPDAGSGPGLAGSPEPGAGSNAVPDWPTGRWVFAVRTGEWQRWWAVDVLPDPFAVHPDPSSPGSRPLG